MSRVFSAVVLGALLGGSGCKSSTDVGRAASSPKVVETPQPKGHAAALKVPVTGKDKLEIPDPGLAPGSDASRRFTTPDAPFPADLELHTPIELTVDSDRPLRIAHAEAKNVHPIVYLHGMCGNSKGADPWVDLATQYGTVIVVRADVPCGDRPGYKWPKELDAIQARIERALELVKQTRAGWLDVSHPSIIGYSQGAYRAEQLAGEYPGRYKRAILGGPPTPPSFEALKTLSAVAVLGGELEDHSHMLEGANDLISHGAHAHFFLLPGVPHGSYGPQGRQVMSAALKYVFSTAEPEN